MRTSSRLPGWVRVYLLLTIAMNMFPGAMPQVTRSVTGMDPDDPRFAERWRAFLVAVGQRLRPTGDT